MWSGELGQLEWRSRPPITGDVSLLLVEDHELVRDSIRLILGSVESDILHIDEAESLHSALHSIAIADQAPDLVLLDLNLTDSEGIQTLSKFRECHPDIPVAVLTGLLDKQTIRSAFEANVSGFIPKSAPQKVIAAAIRLILNGGQYIPSEIFSCFDSSADFQESGAERHHLKPSQTDAGSSPVLTARQREVAQLICRGLSNKEIARKLGVSVGTAKNHVASILTRIGTTTRVKAIRALSDLC